ncbi:MAG: diacylglycerol kinase family protein, partial [Planctomycetota bacterium]
MQSGDHAHILFNPVAGQGRAPRLAERLAQALRGRGLTATQSATSAEDHGAETARQLPDSVGFLFVVGGDGTLRQAAQGLVQREHSPCLAHVPLGNANVVAREWGVPQDPDKAIDALLDGREVCMDVFWAGEKLVLAMVGVGYDAQIAAWMERARRGALSRWYRLHGDSLYGVIGAAAMLKPGRRRFRLELDGREVEGAFTGCIVSNIQTYAKGWSPNPEANACEGLLDFVALRPGWTPNTVLSLFAAMGHRRLPEVLARYGRGRDLVIRAP